MLRFVSGPFICCRLEPYNGFRTNAAAPFRLEECPWFGDENMAGADARFFSRGIHQQCGGV